MFYDEIGDDGLSARRVLERRLVPVNVGWGSENRSASIRAIHSAGSEHSRIESRRPGADANPYLALAVLVASACVGNGCTSSP